MTFPGHIPPFTSTLHEHSLKSSINLWIVIITALFFFLVLSWYNFSIAAYNYYFEIVDKDRKMLSANLFSTLGFAVLWSILSVLLYLYLDYFGYLSASEEMKNLHPLLKDELKDIGPIMKI